MASPPALVAHVGGDDSASCEDKSAPDLIMCTIFNCLARRKSACCFAVGICHTRSYGSVGTFRHTRTQHAGEHEAHAHLDLSRALKCPLMMDEPVSIKKSRNWGGLVGCVQQSAVRAHFSDGGGDGAAPLRSKCKRAPAHTSAAAAHNSPNERYN